MGNIRKYLAISFANNYTDLIIGAVSTIVIARLLTPRDIGVFSVAASVIALAHIVREFGIGNYLIQEKDLTAERLRTALGISIFVAWGMAVALFAVRGAVAQFYGEAELTKILVVMSATFIVIPFTTPALALLRRNMKFSSLYVIGVVNALGFSVTAVSLAALGFGALSLAWGSLAAAVATAIAAAIYQPIHARGWPSFAEWRRVTRFGTISSLTGIVSQVGLNAVDLIVGRTIGFTAVGLYSRANGLISIFHRDLMGAVNNVALPAFALQHRDNRELDSLYLRSVSYILLIAWPFYGLLGLMAFPIVRILFGDQWDEAVPLLEILCVAFAIGATWNLISQVLIASGHVGRVMKSEYCTQPLRIILIFVSANISLKAVAASQILYFIIGMFVYYSNLISVTEIRVGDIFKAVFPSLVVTGFSLTVPVAVIAFMNIGPNSYAGPFIIACAGAGLGWIVGVQLTRHPARDEIKATLTSLLRR
ncbi:MAG: lipopolysaccharide biosynthesis protein [Gammaproteobacteria bacterium]